MAEIPTLLTPRLRLRAPRMEDWPETRDLLVSDRAKYIGGPFDEEGAWGWFCHDVALWTLRGHGALSIEDRAEGTLLGAVSLNDGPLFPEIELGWTLLAAAEGKGIAFEAACAMRDWAFGVRGLPTLISIIEPDNLRSRRLAERMGAVVDPGATGMDPWDVVYRHPAP